MFVAKDREVLFMDFQENPTNGNQNAARKVHCSLRKLFLIFQRFRTNVHRLWRM